MRNKTEERQAAAAHLANPVKRRYVSERELSIISGLACRTLQSWRLRKIGPPWIRLGRAVRYDLAQFESWVGQQG